MLLVAELKEFRESFKDVVSGILFEKYPYFRMVDIPKQKDWHSVSDGGTISGHYIFLVLNILA